MDHIGIFHDDNIFVVLVISPFSILVCGVGKLNWIFACINYMYFTSIKVKILSVYDKFVHNLPL